MRTHSCWNANTRSGTWGTFCCGGIPRDTLPDVVAAGRRLVENIKLELAKRYALKLSDLLMSTPPEVGGSEVLFLFLLTHSKTGQHSTHTHGAGRQ